MTVRLTGRRRTDCAAVSATQVKGNGYVFGAYTHCAWPAAKGIVADPTGKSFLFSLVNANGKAARFSLRHTERAVEGSAYGLFFGAIKMQGGRQTGWPNFALMGRGIAADQNDANRANLVNIMAAYQPDDGQVCNGSFLPGQESFAAEEIEVFQL